MNKKTRKEKRLRCIAYLSVEGDLRAVEMREKKQLRYLQDYAKAHGIDVCLVIRRNGMGHAMVNEHWKSMVSLIQKGNAEGILIANTEAVSSGIPDSFFKIGQVQEVGGVVVTVDEGRLNLPIRRMIDGRMVLINEKH